MGRRGNGGVKRYASGIACSEKGAVATDFIFVVAIPVGPSFEGVSFPGSTESGRCNERPILRADINSIAAQSNGCDRGKARGLDVRQGELFWGISQPKGCHLGSGGSSWR